MKDNFKKTKKDAKKAEKLLNGASKDATQKAYDLAVDKLLKEQMKKAAERWENQFFVAGSGAFYDQQQQNQWQADALCPN